MEYDGNGNVTSNGTYNFKWDVAGRLTEVDQASDGSVIATYLYDNIGRRIQQTVNGQVTKFLYDGKSNRVLAEFDGSGNLTQYYSWSPNGMLLSLTVNGTTYYTVRNGHGDIVQLTDGNGSVVTSYTYDTWGKVLNQTGTAASLNPYRYAGYRYDEAIGLYYLTARYYDPSVGRFLSVDPKSITPSYEYALSNPLSFIDPTGKEPDFIESRFGYYEIDENGNKTFRARTSPLEIGNTVHYDVNNGGKGEELPSKLRQQYPDTEFRFSLRGQKGADVEWLRGKHPSEYEGSTWPKGYDYGDFKPNTKSGWNQFQKDVLKGKLPSNTRILPYDPATGDLIEGDLILPEGIKARIPFFRFFIP